MRTLVVHHLSFSFTIILPLHVSSCLLLSLASQSVSETESSLITALLNVMRVYVFVQSMAAEEAGLHALICVQTTSVQVFNCICVCMSWDSSHRCHMDAAWLLEQGKHSHP